MPGSTGGWELGDQYSEYQYVTRAETFLETQYGKYGGGEKLNILNVLAMISLALGTRSGKEVFAGALGFVPHWYIGGDGFDGMISAMTGVQLYKRRWKTVAFPLVLEVLRTMKDFTKGKAITKLAVSRTTIFAVGYIAAMSRMV